MLQSKFCVNTISIIYDHNTIIGIGVCASQPSAVHLKDGRSGTAKNHPQRQSNLQKKKF